MSIPDPNGHYKARQSGIVVAVVTDAATAPAPASFPPPPRPRYKYVPSFLSRLYRVSQFPQLVDFPRVFRSRLLYVMGVLEGAQMCPNAFNVFNVLNIRSLPAARRQACASRTVYCFRLSVQPMIHLSCNTGREANRREVRIISTCELWTTYCT